METEVVKVEEASPQPMEGLSEAMPPPFLLKTYDMVEDPMTNDVVEWGAARNSFVVKDSHKFAADLLPRYFKHSNFSSFIRQLNTYGFKKVDPNRWEFANEGFLGGQRHLLKYIKRKSACNNQHHSVQQQQDRALVEIGQFGYMPELERLKRDRTVLMVEVLKLKRQQQSSQTQLLALEERLQNSEKRQQHIMAFLAKAFTNPTFVEQLMHLRQQKQQLGSPGKKRRLPTDSNLQKQQGGAKEETIELEMEALLMSMDNDTSSSSKVKDVLINLEVVNDVMMEELLRDEPLRQGDFKRYDMEAEIDQENLAMKICDWDEDIRDLVLEYMPLQTHDLS